MNNILIIDSDPELIRILSQYLKSEGFSITIATDGETGIKKGLNLTFNAIILDLMLPEKTGFEVIQAIRRHSNIPIIVFSAQHHEVNRLTAFELGADEFIAKPCNPREFIAILKAILRRIQQQPPTAQSRIQINHITIDRAQHRAFLHDKDLDLTNAEFNILEMLMKSPEQAFSKEELTEYALGRKFTAYDRSIDVHISNLRMKLGNNVAGKPILKTVRGFGYIFNG